WLNYYKGGSMKEKNRLFLIVDDEPDMCWALEHILKKEGLSSLKAISGQQALEMLNKHPFELVFLDAKLPDAEGLELARQMREIHPEVRIFMVSGFFYQDDEKIQEALSEGLISGFISKPFNHDEIVGALLMTRPL
ncbi:MAG: response regulator, partial [Pseudomonadota bacterium]